MRFTSTRGGSAESASATALVQGLAPDGGLYVPMRWPHVRARRLRPRSRIAAGNRRRAASRRSSRAMRSPPQLSAISRGGVQLSRAAGGAGCRTAGCSVLELFHGPTAAFKDFGARFLAASLARSRAGAAAAAARSWWRPRVTPAAQSPRRSTSARASRWRCCSPKGWSRPRRSGSSPAGAATCGRSRCAAPSTTASAW